MEFCKQFSKYFFISMIFLCFFLLSNKIIAQIDTSSNKKQEKKYVHSVSKATWLSTFIPGAGQIYNKKYWKVPILYAGLGTLGYFIYFNNQNFLTFNDSYVSKFNAANNLPAGNDPYPLLRIETVKLNRDYFERNRNFLIIITCLVHGLNILDAHVDAHLKTFDVSDNLTLKIEPYQDQIQYGNFAGISLKLKWKK
jgi:hypothetical protein